MSIPTQKNVLSGIDPLIAREMAQFAADVFRQTPEKPPAQWICKHVCAEAKHEVQRVLTAITDGPSVPHWILSGFKAAFANLGAYVPQHFDLKEMAGAVAEVTHALNGDFSSDQNVKTRITDALRQFNQKIDQALAEFNGPTTVLPPKP